MLANAIDHVKIACDGWKNLAAKSDDIEVLFERRAVICSACYHKQPLVCGLCGCPLAAKLRAADASCPDGRW